MFRRVFWTTSIAASLLALGSLTLPAQAPAPAQALAKADAEFARKAYDTYRSMQQSSPYRSLSWQYLGPTNISGRATDIAVAEKGGARRIYAATRRGAGRQPALAAVSQALATAIGAGPSRNASSTG